MMIHIYVNEKSQPVFITVWSNRSSRVVNYGYSLVTVILLYFLVGVISMQSQMTPL